MYLIPNFDAEGAHVLRLIQSVMSIKQIRQSRALRRQQILFFHQLVEIEVVDCRRRSVHQKASAVTQWNITSLLSCRGFVVVLDKLTSCSALKNRTIQSGVLPLHRTCWRTTT